jgi:N-hydroxyarylamine O-acetyltransferase
MIDTGAYLARIGLTRVRRPDLETLRELHLAHARSIPFENVDVRLRRPIALDIASLEAKLVRRRRGGYCFDQNTLFAAALRAFGFDVTMLEARVRPPGARKILPRTHMTLAVTVEGREYLVDVGFGADGFLLPVPLDGTLSTQPGGTYRLDEEGTGILVLRHCWQHVWRELYAFSPAPALPVDFEVANHFTSTHPSSPFVNVLTVQRSDTTERHILRGRSYTVRREDEETVRTIGADELPTLLRERFALDVSDEEARAALGDEP